MSTRPARILVVDDEPLNQELLEVMLVPLGYDVDIAANGQECLDKVRASPPDTILLDVMMPGINGFETCKILKSDPRTEHIPIVMVTALREVEHRVAALGAGADDFLSKPVDKLELRTRVRSCLRVKAARDRERRLLHDTLNGAIQVLTEMVSAGDHRAFSDALVLRKMVASAAQVLELRNRWELELAAMLAPVGLVTLPDEIRHRAGKHKKLKPSEQQMLARVPHISHDLVARIPRLGHVAVIIQHLSPAYFGWQGTRSSLEERPVGTRLLEICKEVHHWELTGLSRRDALMHMLERQEEPVDDILQQLFNATKELPEGAPAPHEVSLMVRVGELLVGDILLSDVLTSGGQMLISSGHEVTDVVRDRITNFSKTTGVRQPMQVKRTRVDPTESTPPKGPVSYVVT